MATLYQLHSTIDMLESSAHKIALTWSPGDSIILLGNTVAFIDWLVACLIEIEVEGISAIYALKTDIELLGADIANKLKVNTKLTAILTDSEWVALTQNSTTEKFDKIVTVSL